MRNSSTSAQSIESTRAATSGSSRATKPGLLSTFGLIGWTLFVWVGRIRNILADDDLVGWSQLWRACLAISFVGLALVGAGFLVRALVSNPATEQDAAMRLAKKAVTVLACYGIVIWAIRGTDIFFGSHELAFKAVHTVLAVVTISLGVLVIQRFVRAESPAIPE